MCLNCNSARPLADGKIRVECEETPRVKRRILAVDDDRLTLAAVRCGLERAGYEILPALSGEEALNIAAKKRVDLAVLDISLPGICGMELAKRLHQTRPFPFMFLSSYSEGELVRQANEHGAFAYMVKPLNIVQILYAIEAAMAGMAEISKLHHAEAELTAALAASRDINMAIGVLMGRYGLNSAEAFEVLRSYARRHRRKLSDVAVELLNAGEIPRLFQPQSHVAALPAPKLPASAGPAGTAGCRS